MLKTIIRISESALVNAPIEDVLPQLTDSTAQQSWNACYLTSADVAPGRLLRSQDLYEKVQQASGLTGGSFLQIFRVLYLGRVQHKCSISAHRGMTIFKQTIYIEPRGLWLLLPRFIEQKVRKRMRRSIIALKRSVETTAACHWHSQAEAA